MLQSAASKCLKEASSFKLIKNHFRGISFKKNEDEILDPFQESLMKEQCILVNENDEELGSASKRVCHLKDHVSRKSPLHRAFSLFIFNSQNELLMQQ